jgi:lysophospholipase L1-like esterase
MKTVCQLIMALVLLGIGIPASAQEDPAPYLALGDSIAFGYNPNIPLTTPNLLSNFHGYPQYVSAFLNLEISNASCPGQTSASFLGGLPDNGCNTWRGFNLPLFVSYAPLETQKEFAVSFLVANPDTKLVTLDIGGNDFLILSASCSGSVTCIASGLPALLATYKANLVEILTAVRSTGYKGAIVTVNYASTDYSGAAGTEAIGEVNEVIADVTKSFHGRVADAFSAFKEVSIVSDGLPCGVGLQFFSATGPGCDVHATPAGDLLIARLILGALKRDERHEEGEFDRH